MAATSGLQGISRTPPMITYDDFIKVDIRVGTIVQVDHFPEARKPAFELLSPKGERFLLQGSPYSGQLHRL